jgi:hypothetical protein
MRTLQQWAGQATIQQVSACLEAATETNSSLIYAAPGDPEHLAQLTSKAMEQHGITVVKKSGLLRGEDLEELNAMCWDQQALVDYEAMSKSSFFTGLQQSSFSYNIAVRRHSTLMSQSVGQWWTEEDLDPSRRPWWNEKESSSSGNESPHDILSTLWGVEELDTCSSQLSGRKRRSSLEKWQRRDSSIIRRSKPRLNCCRRH